MILKTIKLLTLNCILRHQAVYLHFLMPPSRHAVRLEAFSEELTEVKAVAEEQRNGTKALSAQALSMSRITKDPRGENPWRCSGQGWGVPRLYQTQVEKSDHRITGEWMNFRVSRFRLEFIQVVVFIQCRQASQQRARFI